MINNRNFKKLLAYSVISSYLLTPFSYATTLHESVLPVVQDLYLKSFDVKRQQEETLESLKKNNQKITLQVKKMNDYEKTELSFKVAGLDTEQQPTHPTALDKTFLKKMELYFGGETNAHHLFGFVDRTTTHVGAVALASMLGQPIFNKQELMQRQAIVKELVENPELFETLETILLQVKDAESEALSYWDQENAVNSELFKKVYFGEWLKQLNQNSTALEAYTKLGNIGTLLRVMPITLVLSLANINFTIRSEINPEKSALHLIKTSLIDCLNIVNPQLHLLKQNPMLTPETFRGISFGDIQKMIQNYTNTSALNANLLLAGIGALSTAWYAFTVKPITEDAILQKNIANHLQTKLIGVATCVETSHTLQSLITNNTVLSQCFAPFNNELLHKQVALSANAKKLIELLHSNTFKGDASFFSMTGRVLAAHQIMNEVKDELAPFFTTIGKLDAYLSIAKLYKEFANNRVGYCFAEFVESDKPFVEAQEFWNPFVDPNVVVTNSVAMGGEHQNNIVLTGPNTGGKSTIIKGIIINILLAQTFGIAPAKRLILTPFKVLNCYLNITDDIATGTSLFMAEVQRAKALLNALNSLTQSEFGFTIMDEVFSGTSPKEGEEAAYQFTEKIGNYGNSLCLVATHFPKLTELDQNNQWGNKHVAVEKGDNGTLHRPFKLNNGKTFQNIAMDLLKDEGIFSDLSDAQVAALG